MSTFRWFPAVVLAICLIPCPTLSGAIAKKDQTLAGPVVHIRPGGRERVADVAATADPTPREDQRPAAVDSTKPCLFLDVFKSTAALEKELNDAAAVGYRVQAAWSAKQEFVLLTKAAGTPNPVQYAVLDGWSGPDLEKALQQAGTQGFHYVPRTLVVSRFQSKNDQGRLRMLVERTPGTEARFEYAVSVHAAEYKSGHPSEPFEPGGTLQKEPLESGVQAIAERGFNVVGLMVQQAIRKRGGLFGGDVAQLEFFLVGERALKETAAPQPSGRYRVIVGLPNLPLQDELRSAVAGSYRLTLTSPAADPVLALIVERRDGTATPPDYVLAGGEDTLPLSFQMNRAAVLGYRAVPGFAFDMPSIAVMAKDGHATHAHEYKVLDGDNRADLTEAMAGGWMPVNISATGMLAVLEKASARPIAAVGAPTPSPAAKPAGAVRRLDAFREATLQKEISETAAQGYRVVRSFYSEPPMVLSMERTDDPSAPFEYVVISDRQDAKLEARMNDVASKGFRFVTGHLGAFVGTWGTETLVLMEKATKGAPAPVKYRVVGAAKRSTFEAELDRARQEGGVVVGMLGTLRKGVAGGRVAILETPAAK